MHYAWYYRGNIYSRLSSNSEANASELLENLREMKKLRIQSLNDILKHASTEIHI